MSVLDFHVHVARREHLTPHVTSYFENEFGASLIESLDSLTPESFLNFLDQEGVDSAVVLAEYSPKATGVVPNEFVTEFCKGTDRLVPFGSIDLDSGVDPARQTEHCIKELGCRGLKLLPPYARFYPDDPRLLPAYEVARDLHIPVMFHTGSSLFPGTRIRYANPLLLDDLAEQFDDLTIIICHAGRPFWYKEAEWMLRRHRNVHIDISGVPVRQLPSVFPHLEQFQDRFFFGSDWPNVPSIAHHLKLIRELPFSQATIRAILWDNAARLLGLDS